jgi:hypothetical protein
MLQGSDRDIIATIFRDILLLELAVLMLILLDLSDHLSNSRVIDGRHLTFRRMSKTILNLLYVFAHNRYFLLDSFSVDFMRT